MYGGEWVQFHTILNCEVVSVIKYFNFQYPGVKNLVGPRARPDNIIHSVSDRNQTMVIQPATLLKTVLSY